MPDLNQPHIFLDSEFGKHDAQATATALAEQKDWHYKRFHVVFYLMAL
jgi:hypothetical protein